MVDTPAIIDFMCVLDYSSAYLPLPLPLPYTCRRDYWQYRIQVELHAYVFERLIFLHDVSDIWNLYQAAMTRKLQKWLIGDRITLSSCLKPQGQDGSFHFYIALRLLQTVYSFPNFPYKTYCMLERPLAIVKTPLSYLNMSYLLTSRHWQFWKLVR